MKRKIITIDQEKCNGCGLCIPNCPEGAIQMIDGKARLISDIFCDGLGACIGHCPEGAIRTEEREAESYDEMKVIVNIVKQGTNTLIAHLKHLDEHGETKFLNQALGYLNAEKIPVPSFKAEAPAGGSPAGGAPDGGAPDGGCPGARMASFRKKPGDRGGAAPSEAQISELTQWPVQLALLNPRAPYLKNADLVIAADCVPFAYPDFHRKFLKDRKLAIFCPKLDQTIENYIEKLAEIFKTQEIRPITALRMEVPCCGGITKVIRQALERAAVDIPVTETVISLQGDIL